MNVKFVLVVILSICVVTHGSVPHLDGRIVGGQPVNIEQFPYQVSVRIYDRHLCGGSILDANTILTAAHCVYDMDHSQYSVRLGANNHQDGVRIRVVRIFIHGNYVPDVYYNDMAILKLATPLRFNRRVQPVQLQLQDVEVPAGTTAYVSGWGVTQEGSKVVPQSLRAVDVAIITKNKCIEKYDNCKITSNMICAQNLGRDSCQGDSGGPLVANGRLIGVVSWGYGCARPEYPGVYAKVSSMHSWIIANKTDIFN